MSDFAATVRKARERRWAGRESEGGCGNRPYQLGRRRRPGRLSATKQFRRQTTVSGKRRRLSGPMSVPSVRSCERGIPLAMKREPTHGRGGHVSRQVSKLTRGWGIVARGPADGVDDGNFDGRHDANRPGDGPVGLLDGNSRNGGVLLWAWCSDNRLNSSRLRRRVCAERARTRTPTPVDDFSFLSSLLADGAVES